MKQLLVWWFTIGEVNFVASLGDRQTDGAPSLKRTSRRLPNQRLKTKSKYFKWTKQEKILQIILRLGNIPTKEKLN